MIRTFADLVAADDAQIDLLSAGIYSLIFTDDSVSLAPGMAPGHGIALAVHQRDATIAATVLDPAVDPALHLGPP